MPPGDHSKRTFLGPHGRIICGNPSGWTLWAVDNTTGVGTKVSEGSAPVRRMLTSDEMAATKATGKTACLTPKA